MGNMEVIHITKKGNMTNTLVRFHTYKIMRLDNQINDKGTVKYNVIYDTIIQRDSDRGHSLL